MAQSRREVLESAFMPTSLGNKLGELVLLEHPTDGFEEKQEPRSTNLWSVTQSTPVE
jgi:hypothetical protein